MKDYIAERAVSEANWVIEKRCTVREAAKAFCVSKSTAHKDLTVRLAEENPVLQEQVAEVLKLNWEERYLRGGIATKKKYQNKRDKGK